MIHPKSTAKTTKASPAQMAPISVIKNPPTIISMVRAQSVLESPLLETPNLEARICCRQLRTLFQATLARHESCFGVAPSISESKRSPWRRSASRCIAGRSLFANNQVQSSVAPWTSRTLKGLR
jgi:hypothetical protein